MQHNNGLETLLFIVLFCQITVHECVMKQARRKKTVITKFVDQRRKERGKDPNLSGRSYDKNTEVRDDTGRSSLIKSRMHRTI